MLPLPQEMRAWAIKDAEPQGRLELVTLPLPVPTENEVLLRVAYAGVNRADLFQKQGLYPPPENASPLPGLEVSGTVVGTGKNVTRWKPGDTVCALLAGGGYAEYCTAHEDLCLPVPTEKLSLRDAAALPEALFTVWMALHEDAGLREGESVLIHGGASGIGTMAIQLARLWNCKIFTTASTKEKCDACTSLGAHHAINYREKDFVEEVRKHTAGKGVDVVLDIVGGNYIQRNFRALATDGRMVSLSFLESAKSELHFGALLLKRITWKGATLRSRSLAKKKSYAESIREKLWKHVLESRIHAIVDDVFMFHDAEKTHTHMQDNLNIGKILIRIET